MNYVYIGGMSFSRRRLLSGAGGLLAAASLPDFSLGQVGAPAGAADAYANPKPMNAGPFQPTWESLRDHYRVPHWFNEAKFGIFIHWGLYSIPARINEWYERHMYTSDVKWHTEHYGAPDKFGYKDFIPLFTAKKFDAAQWTELFAGAGARYVVPVAEHHDGFAMYDSALTPWCAGRMGPRRDFMAELARESRKGNLVFGLSSHRMEHDSFAYPGKDVPNDQFDPRFAGFYGPPIPGEFNNSNASQAFQNDWLARVQELVDKYEPQLIYFDNGVNTRAYDAVKLQAAAYYYNRVKDATLATKDLAYLFGSVQDFEKQSRAPRAIYNAAGWQVDDALGSTWGYTEGMTVRSADSVVRELVEMASMGGNLLLNISPMGDGSIPDAQQKVLLEVGAWLKVHGAGIYGSRAWVRSGEGPMTPPEAPGDWKGGSTDVPGPKLAARAQVKATAADFRFTLGAGALYAFGYVWPGSTTTIASLAAGKAMVQKVSLLGGGVLKFRQTAAGLMVEMPSLTTTPKGIYGLKVEGSLNFGV